MFCGTLQSNGAYYSKADAHWKPAWPGGLWTRGEGDRKGVEGDEIRSLSKRDDNLGRKLPYIKITRGKKAFRIPRIIQHSCIMAWK